MFQISFRSWTISSELSTESVHVKSRIVRNYSSSSPEETYLNELSLTETDVIKYEKTSFSFICDYDRRSTGLFSGAHHKTGSSLLNILIINTILKYWRSHCAVDKERSDRLDVAWNIGHGHTHKDRLRRFVDSWNGKGRHFIILHLIRDPVDTILSGYNYHKITWENWTKTRIRAMRRRVDLCEAMDDVMERMDSSYLDDTLQNIYNTNDVAVGLDIEYHRYILCAFPHIEDSYRFVKGIYDEIGNTEYTHFWNLRLEHFQHDFNRTIQVILNALGVRGSDHMINLMGGMQQFDVYGGHRAKRVVTTGSYNKTHQINVLLSNRARCLELKRRTLALDYKWKHWMFC